MRLFAIAGAFFIAASAGAMAEPTATTTVPIQYEDARAYVQGFAQGQDLGWFILDDGFGSVALDSETAARLHLAAGNDVSASGAGTGKLRLGVVPALDLDIGADRIQARSVKVGPFDKLLSPYTGRHVPGIVGAAFFQQRVVEVDFPNGLLRLHDPTTYVYRGAGTRVPFEFDGTAPIVRATLSLPDGRTLAARLFVDLGAKAPLLLTEPFLRRHAVAAAFGTSVVSPLGAGVGGETHYMFVRLPAFALEPQGAPICSNCIAGLSVGGTLRDSDFDGLLGAEFLHSFNVIFDYPHRQIIFEAGQAGDQAFDRSGLFLIADGPALNRFVVRSVSPNSPAAAAMIAPGDRLVAIDGRSVAPLRLADIRDRLKAQPGTVVALELERAGKSIAARLTLRDQL